MKIKGGEVLLISDLFRGRYWALARADFDTQADPAYPLIFIMDHDADVLDIGDFDDAERLDPPADQVLAVVREQADLIGNRGSTIYTAKSLLEEVYRGDGLDGVDAIMTDLGFRRISVHDDGITYTGPYHGRQVRVRLNFGNAGGMSVSVEAIPDGS